MEEAFAVIWLGLPSLVTAFVGYPLLLSLLRIRLASAWTPSNKRRATAFAICSAGLFLLSGLCGFLAWRRGFVLTLHGCEPLMRLTSLTVSACFVRFARSLLEFGILLQLPLLAFFLLLGKASHKQQAS